MLKYAAGGEGSEAPLVRATAREIKALTLQHPNERELKNELRWIYGWNLWTELIRQRLEIFSDERNIETESSKCYKVRHELSKENLLSELESHIITKPIKTLSKVKTIRRIKEVGVKVAVWESVRREGVDLLSSIQIRCCEYKAGDRDGSKCKLRLLDEIKQKIVEKIVTASENIDFHNKEMELAIDLFKNFRCHGLFVDPVVSDFIEKFHKRVLQPYKLRGFGPRSGSNTPPVSKPDESVIGDCVVNSSKKSLKSKKSNIVPCVPDFVDPLFAGKTLPAGKPRKKQEDHESNLLSTKDFAGHFVQIVQQGTEWYLAWSQFTESVLREIKSLTPSLGSEVVTFMTKHINRQITILRGLHVEARSVSEKLKCLCVDEMSVMITCLSLVDDFISLIESLKHESSYLIRYVEIALINMGVLDLGTEPSRLQPLRLYLIRNVISMKDNHLLSSIDYLYTEMATLLEFIELRFHNDANYLEKFGPVTADLLKKYTKNRKDAIQEKEFENLQSVDEMELAREMCPALDDMGKSPLSRYQRAEDIRRWVEQSKAVSSGTNDADGLDAVEMGGISEENVAPSEESWGSAAEDQENLNNKDSIHKGSSKLWKVTKSNAHSLGKDLKKRLSLKKKN